VGEDADQRPVERQRQQSDVLEQVERQQTAIVLDGCLLAMLAEVTSAELRERVQTQGLASLIEEERTKTVPLSSCATVTRSPTSSS
jgi:hypothetical protein